MRHLHVSNGNGQPPSPKVHHHHTPPLQPNPNPPLEKKQSQTNSKLHIPLITDGDSISFDGLNPISTDQWSRLKRKIIEMKEGVAPHLGL